MSVEYLNRARAEGSLPNPQLPNYQLLYFLPACGSLISFLYFVIFLFQLGYFYGGVTNLVFSLAYLLTFVFYLLGKARLGKHFLALSFITQIFIDAVYLFPREAYFQLYFLVAIPLVFMVFDAQEKIARLFYCSVVVVALGYIQLGQDNLIRPFNFVPADIWITQNFNLFCSFLVLSLSAYMYVRIKENSEQETHLLASTDALTGLYNRRHFYPLAQQQFWISKRSSAALSLLFIDIDFFKQVNDQYGHKAGDDTLKFIAKTIGKRCRESDILARTGGDEFILLLANSDQQAAALLAEVILQSVSIGQASLGPAISISIGIAQLEAQDSNLDHLLQRADKALYRAKKRGRNRYQCWQAA